MILPIACLILTSLVTITLSYPKGIQHDSETLETLKTRECLPCYDEFYKNWTTTAKLLKCTGPYLFVGARRTSNSTFLIGAFGLATDVMLETPYDHPHLSNGVYWYKTHYYSFGFLGNTDLRQAPSDFAWRDQKSRLSWNLDRNFYGGGGFRAGSIRDLDFSLDYKKAIFSCPLIDVTRAPSASPSKGRTSQTGFTRPPRVPRLNRTNTPSAAASS